MPVKKRNGRFQADITWKNKRYRKSFDTEPQALRWEADARARLLEGKPLDDLVSAPADGHTLQSLLEARRA
jgi:hypothetical protein